MREFFFSLKRYSGVSKCVPVKYQGYFMQPSIVGSFKGVPRKFQESFKEDLRVF